MNAWIPVLKYIYISELDISVYIYIYSNYIATPEEFFLTNSNLQLEPLAVYVVEECF